MKGGKGGPLELDILGLDSRAGQEWSPFSLSAYVILFDFLLSQFSLELDYILFMTAECQVFFSSMNISLSIFVVMLQRLGIIKLLLELVNPYENLLFELFIEVFVEVVVAASLEMVVFEVELVVVTDVEGFTDELECSHFEVAWYRDTVASSWLKYVHDRLPFHQEPVADWVILLLLLDSRIEFFDHPVDAFWK